MHVCLVDFVYIGSCTVQAMKTAEGSSEEDSSKAKATEDETKSTAEDNAQEDFEMTPIQTSECEPSVKESSKLVSGISDTSLKDESSLMNEDSEGCEVNVVMNGEIHEGKEASNCSSLQQQTRQPRTRTRIVKLLSRGSLFAIGLAVLVTGGVSSNFTPYIEPWEYDNCTITEE